MSGIARHPVTTFALVFGLILLFEALIDGQVELWPAIFGAIGGVVGVSLLEWRRRRRS